MEYLEGVRVLYNTDDSSRVEIVTNTNIYKVDFTFNKKELQNGHKNKYTYRYPISIKDFCKSKGINYKDYFYILHNDVD